MPDQHLKGKPWNFKSEHGTIFSAQRSDLEGGVDVLVPSGLSRECYTADVAEAMMHHRTMIHPHLNGFRGYDTVEYRVVDIV